jgi:hypothetical protein
MTKIIIFFELQLITKLHFLVKKKLFFNKKKFILVKYVYLYFRKNDNGKTLERIKNSNFGF